MRMPEKGSGPEALSVLVGLASVCSALGACSDGDAASGGVIDLQPWFEDQAVQRGIDFHHVSGSEGQYLMPEIMGGGAALADVDGDGDLDAYVVQSGEGLMGAASADSGNRLFLNRGDGFFAVVADSGAEDRGYGMGVAAGDYDNDGDVDLYVTNVGANVLLRNDGSGRFEDVTDVAGVGDLGWGTAATFADLDADGDLDIFVVNYVLWRPGIERACYDYGTGVRNYCDPRNYNAPTADRLYRNDGDGTFTEVGVEAGIADALGNGLGVVGVDVNGDNLLDVFVANDQTLNHLWLNRGGLRFTNEAVMWGCAMDDEGIAKAGMGVAAGDVDDDGDPDLLVVNIEGETDSFFRNDGDHFVDATARFGLGATTRRRTRFGLALADFDNDGRLDLYEANGRVAYSPEPDADDVFAEPNALFRGTAGGAFGPVLPEGGVARSLIHTSRGVAVGDVDADGGMDLLVVNRDGPAYLLMNRVSGQGAWLRFQVRARSGRHALGATVSANVGEVRMHRDVPAGGSYLSSPAPQVHLGLGSRTSVGDVRVRWPDGATEAFGDFEAGQTVDLRQGDGMRREGARTRGGL